MNAGDPKLHFGINCLVAISALGCSVLFVSERIMAMIVLYAIVISIVCIGPKLKSSVGVYVMSVMAFFFLYMATELNQKPIVRDWQNKTKYLEQNDTIAELQKTIAELRRKNRELEETLDFNLQVLEQSDVKVLELQKTITELSRKT
jgi:hypothetical protein